MEDINIQTADYTLNEVTVNVTILNVTDKTGNGALHLLKLPQTNAVTEAWLALAGLVLRGATGLLVNVKRRLQ